MKTILIGGCQAQNVYELVDPSTFSEIEFESEVVAALTCLYPDYICGVFGGSFLLDGARRTADLALIHRKFSHWFIVEVELVSHSLENHVLPQVRCFRFGDAETACISSLLSGFPQLTRKNAEALLTFVPKHVVVVSNRMDPRWLTALSGLDVQLLSISILENIAGQRAHEVEGRLTVREENLGFARYSAIEKSLIIARTCGLPIGSIRIEDDFGIPSLWTVRESENALWITKDQGDPMIPHDEYVQIRRSSDGRVSLHTLISR